MTGITLAALLQVSLAVADMPKATSAPVATPYDQAMKSAESGKPILILIGADWCPYCKVVQRDVLPVLQERGLMEKVIYVYLDYDRDRQLVGKTLRGEIIPEMIMFRKTEGGWKRSDISGSYKVAEIEPFIKANLKEAELPPAAKAEAAPAVDKKPVGEPAPADKVSEPKK
jgi:thiol-disulfide isomerase/thioredoxin